MLSGDLTTGLRTTRSGIAEARVEAGRDPAGVLGDLLQRCLAVQILAAGDEPDLEAGERLHCALPGRERGE